MRSPELCHSFPGPLFRFILETHGFMKLRHEFELHQKHSRLAGGGAGMPSMEGTSREGAFTSSPIAASSFCFSSKALETLALQDTKPTQRRKPTKTSS